MKAQQAITLVVLGLITIHGAEARVGTNLPLQSGIYVEHKSSCEDSDSADTLKFSDGRINSAHVLGRIVSSKLVDGAYAVRIRNKGDGGVGGDRTWLSDWNIRVLDTKRAIIRSEGTSTEYRWCRS